MHFILLQFSIQINIFCIYSEINMQQTQENKYRTNQFSQKQDHVQQQTQVDCFTPWNIDQSFSNSIDTSHQINPKLKIQQIFKNINVNQLLSKDKISFEMKKANLKSEKIKNYFKEGLKDKTQISAIKYYKACKTLYEKNMLKQKQMIKDKQIKRNTYKRPKLSMYRQKFNPPILNINNFCLPNPQHAYNSSKTILCQQKQAIPMQKRKPQTTSTRNLSQRKQFFHQTKRQISKNNQDLRKNYSISIRKQNGNSENYVGGGDQGKVSQVFVRNLRNLIQKPKIALININNLDCIKTNHTFY